MACGRVIVPEDNIRARQTISQVLKKPGLRAVFVLSEGNHVNGSDLVRGLNSILPSDVVVTGGLAGDGDRFKRTWIVHEGLPKTDMVGAVGFYGEHIMIRHGSEAGWGMFGVERTGSRSAA